MLYVFLNIRIKITNYNSLDIELNCYILFFSSTMPKVDRSSKPLSLLSAKTGGLRTIIVPEELLSRFISLSDSNTMKNIETCGVLAGRLVSF